MVPGEIDELNVEQLDVEPIEPFIGIWMADDKEVANLSADEQLVRQNHLQELYEGRIASLERFVAFLVLFHNMAKQVQVRAISPAK